MLLIVPFPPRASRARSAAARCVRISSRSPPARRARSYSVKSMDGRARCHTCRGAGAGREPGKIVRRGRTHWGPSGRTLPLHRSARPAHMEGACLSASFHPPAGTAVHGHPPAAPPHKTSPPRKKSGPAARQPPALHHPAPRRRQKVRPNAALPPSFGRCFCPSLSMAGGSGGGRIARQAATIRAAAPLSVSPPAGPARGGRNRRRACHMAGRGSAPRRQDGVPSAQSRGRRQPSGQRPRCPSARLPVPRVAGAIAAAHAIWREGGAPRAGRTEFPPRIARLNFPHASRVGTHRRVKFLPRVAGGGIRRRAHRAAGGNHPGSGPVDRQPACRSLLAHGGRNRRRAYHMAGRGSAPHRQDGVPSAHRGSGGNHPGSGPVVRQPACRSRAWRAQSPPRMPYGGKGERPAQAGRSSLRASRG